MHLLQAQAGGIADGSEAVDLGQTPGDIVVLSAADTEIANLAAARAALPELKAEVRLANVMQLGHNLSVDIYVEEVISRARLVVVRLLGGVGYWSYGVEQLQEACRRSGALLALLPGDEQPDPELSARSSAPPEACHRLWQYCVQGGPDNARHFLVYTASLIGEELDWEEPRPLLRYGLYWPGREVAAFKDLQRDWRADAPSVAIVFYRAHLQAGNLAPVDGLLRALRERDVNPLPIFVSSLKDPACAGFVRDTLRRAETGLVLNGTGFAISAPGQDRSETPFDVADCPVLQVVFSGGTEDAWRSGFNGLSARDIAMNVALPEVDGRILSRAVSFKGEARYDAATQCPVVSYQAKPDRIDFVADLAVGWLRLRNTPAQERRLGLVLANYPNRDGRMGNGVGLDTPAGTVEVMRALAAAGYDLSDIPEGGNALVQRLQEGPTNAATDGRRVELSLSLPDYENFFEGLPAEVRDGVLDRWGPPQTDPFFLEDKGFAISAFRCGKILIGLQPARGYNIDPSATYHDPDLVPPHGYLAFYAFLRRECQAVVHMGKHGNLEWLPGKSLALSAACFPEAVFGPLPHIYPFIVNDPGEGTQAKRRAQAVIIDHLTPPLTRAETYGPLADLERLVDEYYDASGVDPRRLSVLRDEILDLSARMGLDKDCGVSAEEDADSALTKLDNYLCELKEMQIRDGLHIFGQAPEGGLLDRLLVALTRIPRGEGKDGDASLLRALAADLGLRGFEPLDCRLGDLWTGPRPEALLDEGTWRTQGDTVERLEDLAERLVAGMADPEEGWLQTRAVLNRIGELLRPNVCQCGIEEIKGTLAALDGRFVAPGPSGAPTRGRLDVLPTGRNFYSVDSRTVPTAAAWTLGWKSAAILIERYRQEEGAWPRCMALSAWGTSNMRTGGDDIAQALALLGVRPTWEVASRRVTGFEILPLSLLDRPRVDVTLRISGFFRDAFPTQIDLFDSAVRAICELDEPDEMNPLAASYRADLQRQKDKGLAEMEAKRAASTRVFGSKPGAYGAGLQALIDERGWHSSADLAQAYLAWGGYAYGGGREGEAAHSAFQRRLSGVQAVVHNQDNREHDLLDSDDYFQFEGGLTAAVKEFSGTRPTVYHNDHSLPERPVIRTLEDEIARVVRARVVNPKWIAGVMRHGYKGAFEMAATVDYLFAFAATTGAVADHHFDAVYDAYLGDEAVQEFLAENNPAAQRELAERLLEAQERGLWKPRRNAAYDLLQDIGGRGAA